MADKTEYVILRAITMTTGGGPHGAITEARATQLEAWTECGTALGHGNEQAVRTFLEEDTTLPEGEHRLKAVPARSWPEPLPAVVTTKRTAAIARPSAAPEPVIVGA